MSWESRNNRRYYYRRRKVGGRVIAEYLGADRSAQLARELDAARRVAREAQESALRTLKAQEAAIDAQIDDLGQQASDLIAAELISRGYRLHSRGEWRKKCDRSSSKNISSKR
jgi:hypothetical protein